MAATSTPSANPTRDISRGVIAIKKEYTGRGPVRAHTSITNSHVMTICEGGLTKAEERLVSLGDAEVVRIMRRKFQESMNAAVTELVERVTGRTVNSILFDYDVTNDIAVELVIFSDGALPGSTED